MSWGNLTAMRTPVAVVAVDFATHAAEICRRAAPLLQGLGANVVLLYQIEVQNALAADVTLYPGERAEGVAVGDYLQRDAERHMAPLVALLREEGLQARLRISHGPVIEGILACARAERADVLVVGSDVRAGLGRLVQANFTESVLRGAECPVLVIRALGEGGAPGVSEARAQVRSEDDG